ncbi:CBM96 family carbohydrate-binding protein [Paenibacillus sp. CMAA1364]
MLPKKLIKRTSSFLSVIMLISLILQVSFPALVSADLPPVYENHRNLRPIADAYVDSGTATVNTNYGTSVQAVLKEGNATTKRRLYLKFDLTDAKLFTTAKLRLYMPIAGAAEKLYLYPITDDAWTETGITSNNQPIPSTTTLVSTASVGQAVVGAGEGWYEWDISAYTNEKNAGTHIMSLLLIGTADATNRTVSTKESGVATAPQLILDYGGIAPSYQSTTVNSTFTIVSMTFDEPIVDATGGSLKSAISLAANGVDYSSLPAEASVSVNANTLTIALGSALIGTENRIKLLPNSIKDTDGNMLITEVISGKLSGGSGSITDYEQRRILLPTADAGVDSGTANLNKNYGNTDVVQLKEGTEIYNRRLYLKYNLNDAKQFNSAMLRLYLPLAGTSAETLKLYTVPMDTWTENGLTYANQPVPVPAASAIVAQTIVGTTEGWYEWDITAYTQAQLVGDKTMSLLLTGTANVNRTVSTKESGANAPQLVLDYDVSAPQVTEIALQDQNSKIVLRYNEKITNHTADMAALKKGIQIARNGTAWTALAITDGVQIVDKQLILNLSSRLSIPGAKLKMDGHLLRDTQGNLSAEWVSDVLPYDSAAPVIQTAGLLDESNKMMTIRANEYLVNALANDAALKSAVTYAADGVNFAALDATDSIALVGGELVMTKTVKLATDSKVKIAAGTLKDVAGNVVSDVWTSDSINVDVSAPVIQEAYVSNFNKKVVLLFNKSIAVNGLDTAQFKASVQRSQDGGTNYVPLGAQDEVKISGNTITVILIAPMQGSSNRFRIDSGALKDLSGNIAPALESEVLASEEIKYPYAPPSEEYLVDAMKDSVNVTFENKAIANGSGVEMTTTGAVAAIAMAIAHGDRDPAYIERYVSTVRKMITTEANMPNLMGGLDSRQQSPLLQAIALLWNDEEIMQQFTADERSKLITLFKAGLIATAYTLSDFDINDNPRSAQRIAVNGDTNVWNGGNSNFSEPNITIFLAASFVLGLENVKSIMKDYNFDTFNAELNQQGLTTIYKSFISTTNFGTLAAKKQLMEKIVQSNKWSFKGVSLDRFIANPMELYHETQRYMWSLTAEDGDYMGEPGMAQEFYSTDAAGSRQSSGYAVLGIDPSLLNRIMLHVYGFWNMPNNQTIADEINRWQMVGVSDYYAKVMNGYYAQSWLGTHMEYLTPYKSLVDNMFSVGLLHPVVFNDTFNYDSIINPITNHWILGSGNWVVEKNTIIPFNRKTPLTTALGATAVDPEEKLLSDDGTSASAGVAYTKNTFKDVSYMAWVQPSASGEAGLLARVSDANNYYLMSYNAGKLYIKKNVNGVMTTIAEQPFTVTPGTAYRFKGTFTGEAIELYVNSILQLSVTDVSHVEGAIGLYNWGASAKFDGILVQPTKAEAPVLKTLQVGDGQLTVNIAKVEGATQYKVKYGTQPGQYTSTMLTGKTRSVIKGLTNNTTYYVAVSAVTAIGESEISNELSMAPVVPDVVTPVLSHVIADGNKLIVSFTTDPKNTSYIIRYGNEAGNYTNSVEGLTEGVNAIQVNISGTPYYFVVAGVNATGISPNSNELVGKANSDLLFSDDFTDGEFLNDWTLSTGAFQLQENNSNYHVLSTGSNPDRMWVTEGMNWKDYSVSAKIKMTPDTANAISEGYLLGRTTNVFNYYLIGYKLDKTAGKGYAAIRKKVNSVISSVKEVEFPLWNDALEHTLRAEFNGSNIKLYIDGQLGAEAEDNSLPIGTAGLLSANAAVSYDDFQVEKLNGVARPVIEEVLMITTTEATVKFGLVTEADGYRIKYGKQPNLYTEEMDVVAPASEGVPITGLEAGSTYYFAVSGYRNGLEGENSTEVSNMDVDPTPLADATLVADPTAPTNGNVSVTITYPTDVTLKEYKVGIDGTWTVYSEPVVVTANDTVYARGSNVAGNVSNVTSIVISNIDKVVAVGTVTYAVYDVITNSVQATLNTSKPVTITNNDGLSTYLFTSNGSFTFEFIDAVGNQGTATATVNSIVSKSTAIPAKPVLSSDNGYDNGILDGQYVVTMNQWYGNNGKIYKLYENDVLIEIKILTDNSPSAQIAATSISGRKNGTYRYYAQLINAFGTTTSDTLVVNVTQADPGIPVISNDNWDGDGMFKVSMNMWWGTNGTSYRLYENDVLIDTQTLTSQTSSAQSALTNLTNRAAGTYTYRAELVNDSGATSSSTMTVTVTH